MPAVTSLRFDGREDAMEVATMLLRGGRSIATGSLVVAGGVAKVAAEKGWLMVVRRH